MESTKTLATNSFYLGFFFSSVGLIQGQHLNTVMLFNNKLHASRGLHVTSDRSCQARLDVDLASIQIS
jgi:hypothetical protein